MKRSVAMAAVTVLMAGALVGCGDSGGGDTASYCDSLKSAKDTFGDLEGTSSADLEKAFDQVSELADQAPDEIQADWKVLDDAINKIKDGLEQAGLKLSDLDKISAGEMPEDFDPAKLQDLAAQMHDLSSEKVQKAADNIEKHAKDECDVDLSSS